MRFGDEFDLVVVPVPKAGLHRRFPEALLASFAARCRVSEDIYEAEDFYHFWPNSFENVFS